MVKKNIKALIQKDIAKLRQAKWDKFIVLLFGKRKKKRRPTCFDIIKDSMVVNYCRLCMCLR